MYNEEKVRLEKLKIMSKKLFTEKESRILATNPNVKSVSSKGITYTDDFKRAFIAENEMGMFPREIFEAHGFDIEILGIERVKAAGKRWRAAYKKDGLDGLRDTRKGNSGRSSDKELSIEEKFARIKAENIVLKAENELLKKIDMIERGLKRKK